MIQEQTLAEKVGIKAEVPVDMNTAAITGTRIKLDKAFRLAFVVNMGDSTAAVVDFTLKQHNAASAGTSKVLSVANPYYKKVGAAAAAFTKVQPTSAASNYVLSSDFSDSEGVVIFEVGAEDLDVTNDYAWVSLDVADSTAAKLISVVHVLHNLKQTPGYSLSL